MEVCLTSGPSCSNHDTTPPSQTNMYLDTRKTTVIVSIDPVKLNPYSVTKDSGSHSLRKHLFIIPQLGNQKRTQTSQKYGIFIL